MISFRMYSWLACVALLAASGCKKETPPPAETKTETEAKATTEKKDSSRNKNRNADEGVEVPTEEDFEVEVEKQITQASDLGKELDLLEKQIQGK
jgi:hypothetical protein